MHKCQQQLKWDKNGRECLEVWCMHVRFEFVNMCYHIYAGPHRTNDKRWISASFGRIVICGTRTTTTTTPYEKRTTWSTSHTHTHTHALVRTIIIYCKKKEKSIHRTFWPIFIESKDDGSIKIYTAAKKFAWFSHSMTMTINSQCGAMTICPWARFSNLLFS